MKAVGKKKKPELIWTSRTQDKNIKFQQFMIRCCMLTQKHYESNLIRPKIENLSKQYPIDPKINMSYD